MNRRQTHYGGMGMWNQKGRNKNNNNNHLSRHHSMAMAPRSGVLQNNMNMNNRRSSLMMQSHLKVTKDPRPLKDKQWIEKQIEFLIEFLCSHGYESSMLSPKELNPPSTKNFQYICCFLFQQIDPTFINLINNSNQNGFKFEEECIAFFEKLGYPFKINKSSLKCIAPHSWPPLLGAISWIIELLIFAESFDDDDDDKDDDSNGDIKMKDNNNDKFDEEELNSKSAKSDRMFFNLVADNYGLWLKGKDDDETITQRLMNVYTQKIEYLKENIESFNKANEQLITEKQRIETECPKISSLQDQRQNTIEALNQINNVIKERDEYIETVKKKYQEWDNKVNEKLIKINDSEEKIKELKETISKQTISPKDVEIMNRESNQLNAKKDELQLQKEEIKRKQYDITENINNILKKTRILIRDYNDLGQKIEIIPINARYSFQQDHVLKLRQDILNNNEIIINKCCDLCNTDLVFVENSLEQLMQHFKDKIRTAQVKIKNESEEISQIEKVLNTKKKELEILNDRLSYITNLYDEEKSKMSLLTANTARSIEKIELSMNQQSNDIEGQLKNKKKEFTQINNKYNQRFEECKKIEIQLTSKVGICISKLIKHRQTIREQLRSVNKRLDDALDKVAFYHIQEPTIAINTNIDHHMIHDIEMQT